jgi:hypothetical protein
VEAFAKNSKPKGFEDIVLTSLHTYADVFSETAFDSLPEHRKWDHAIELERKPSPGFCKVYPMTLTEPTDMDAFLEEALATGRIRQSKSPLGAPVFFIKKTDGKIHFVQDYRALNTITRKNQYLLPPIDDLIHWLRDTHYFTKLDVRWGYNNVRCNVPHNFDLRNATYEPASPLICRLSPPFPSLLSATAFSAIVITTTAVSVTAAVFSVTAAATSIITVPSATVTVFAVTAAAASIILLPSVSLPPSPSLSLPPPFPSFRLFRLHL